MLKMAQQLALAEADLQERNALGMQQDEQQQRDLDQQQQWWAQEAAAVDACVPAGLALLRLAKESQLQFNAAAPPAHTLIRQEARQVLVQACPGLIHERIDQVEGRWNMLGLDSATVGVSCLETPLYTQHMPWLVWRISKHLSMLSCMHPAKTAAWCSTLDHR
jgi:hypothetical protein